MGNVVTIDYTMKIPKEGKEIVDAETKLVDHFMRGGKLEDAAKFLPDLMAAVDNFKQVVVEVRSKYRDELAGYLVHRQWEAFDPSQPLSK